MVRLIVGSSGWCAIRALLVQFHRLLLLLRLLNIWLLLDLRSLDWLLLTGILNLLDRHLLIDHNLCLILQNATGLLCVGIVHLRCNFRWPTWSTARNQLLFRFFTVFIDLILLSRVLHELLHIIFLDWVEIKGTGILDIRCRFRSLHR